MNCKIEFLALVADMQVLCAQLHYDSTWHWDDEDTGQTFNLPLGYTSVDYKEFLASLDFEYDNGYGAQLLEGTVWFTDGTWAERGEYDGSEWWDYHSCPEVPSELKGDQP